MIKKIRYLPILFIYCTMLSPTVSSQEDDGYESLFKQLDTVNTAFMDSLMAGKMSLEPAEAQKVTTVLSSFSQALVTYLDLIQEKNGTDRCKEDTNTFIEEHIKPLNSALEKGQNYIANFGENNLMTVTEKIIMEISNLSSGSCHYIAQ